MTGPRVAPVPAAAGPGHWEDVYRSRSEDTLSWYEPDAASSLRILDDAGLRDTDSLLDVGAGAGRLVAALHERGHTDLTALDISHSAVTASRRRLGPVADRIEWVVADLLGWEPSRPRDVWHDRAVFHFLAEPHQRTRYRAVLDAALASGGLAVIGTFAPDGPPQCSGLPVLRYDADDLHRELGGGLSEVARYRVEHVTPSGGVQPFTWLALRRG